MQKEKKKLKTMIILNSISLGLVVLCFLTIIINAVVSALALVNYDGTNGAVESTVIGGTIVAVLFIVLFGIAAGVINLYLSIKILATDWQNKWCKENKLLWGLLSLLLLGFIGIYVFACCGSNNIKNSQDAISDQNQPYSNNPFSNGPQNPNNNPFDNRQQLGTNNPFNNNDGNKQQPSPSTPNNN